MYEIVGFSTKTACFCRQDVLRFIGMPQFFKEGFGEDGKIGSCVYKCRIRIAEAVDFNKY